MSVAESETSPLRNRSLTIIAVIGGLALIVIVGLVFWSFSTVKGSEFSPTHFQSRNFTFREIPLLGIQITGVARTSTTAPTAQYLAAKKLISVPVTASQRWDLIRINRSSYPADTEILTQYLDGTGGSRLDWEKWSKDHPKAAGVLWPIVQQMAIDRLYLMIPRVFELAENETDPTELKKDLDAYITAELPSMATDLAAAGHRQLAVDVLKSAIARYPQHSNLASTLSELQGG